MPAPQAGSPGGGVKSHTAGRSGKTIEQIYQKKTQLEHILLRPDTYVGSCEPQMQEMWVFDESTQSMQFRKITYSPALYKIFDEILVNAADHLQRSASMDVINVKINKLDGTIAVYNNGAGVPVVMHQEHKIYVPELIFGNLLTSDNYDDNEKKVTGGRNGFGAKLTNVFSKKFVIETADAKEKKRFTQVMENNMSVKNKPKIEEYKKEPYTRVTFTPDLAKFHMTELDDDTIALFYKRVWDIAATTDKRCKVFLNDKRLPITDFKSYCEFFVKSTSATEIAEGNKPLTIVHEKCGTRWEVCVTLSLEQQFQQVSFVNSINTIKGGTHVAHVTEQLVEVLLKKAQAGNKKGMAIKPANVKQHLWVFVNCLVENPAFDSQTKETLKTQASKFGTKCELSDAFIKDVQKSGVIDMIVNWAKAKEKVDLGRKLKSSGNQVRVLGIPKLEDANEAGGKKSSQCTLILTEGDSAKALAVAGLSVIGRDFYGVFPLRGKLLNVREAAHATLLKNAEIQAILKIMGLTPGVEYDDLNKLRYGSIMIMTDQDLDGSHIKGLLINLIEAWWPSLMKYRGFLKEFVTPIIKVHKGGKNEKKFYTLADYEVWKGKNNNGKGWDIKYYKGLGTSTAKEAKEYFRDIEVNEIKFTYDDSAKEAVDLAFNKTRADDRKDWMNGAKESDTVDHNKKELAFTDFVNKELVWFSKYAALRAIPNVIDGFKPGQRKIIFCAFKKKIKKDIKVAQFVGYVSEKGAYHHGEKSLEDTIVNMAQDFVGSNNLNLFFPSGQFGTRLAGGSDHASARYIFTRLMPYTRTIFNETDDNVLTYQNEEGQWIEPHFYVPVIPMVLVNGAQGIGVGWSTSIPNFNPLEIVDNLRRYLRGQAMTEMKPWYRGFIGEMSTDVNSNGTKFIASGVIQKTSETTLEILELPLKEWTSSYKEFLEGMLPGAAKAAAAGDDKNDNKSKKGAGGNANGNAGNIQSIEAQITDCREYHTENTVHFLLKLTEEQMQAAEETGLEQMFKLRASVATTNMMLFDSSNRIKRYETAGDILNEFAIVRLEYYDKRKKFQIDKLGREKVILDAKVRFILAILANRLEIRNKKKKDLVQELLANNYQRMSEIQKGNLGTLPNEEREGGNKDDKEDGEDAEEDEAGGPKADDFNYLLGMPLWNLTQEKVEELKRQLSEKTDELNAVLGTSREEMWDRDLIHLRDQIQAEWTKQEKEEDEARKVRANKKKQAEVKELKKPARGRKPATQDDDDDNGKFAPKLDPVQLLKTAAAKRNTGLRVNETSAVQFVNLDEKRQYMETRQVSDRVEKRTGGRRKEGGNNTQKSQGTSGGGLGGDFSQEPDLSQAFFGLSRAASKENSREPSKESSAAGDDAIGIGAAASSSSSAAAGRGSMKKAGGRGGAPGRKKAAPASGSSAGDDANYHHPQITNFIQLEPAKQPSPEKPAEPQSNIPTATTSAASGSSLMARMLARRQENAKSSGGVAEAPAIGSASLAGPSSFGLADMLAAPSTSSLHGFGAGFGGTSSTSFASRAPPASSSSNQKFGRFDALMETIGVGGPSSSSSSSSAIGGAGATAPLPGLPSAFDEMNDDTGAAGGGKAKTAKVGGGRKRKLAMADDEEDSKDTKRSRRGTGGGSSSKES